jgi:hypothetical protein
MVTANIKPLPAFAARISNADIARGEKVGAFNVWPIARPIIAIERNERLNITLRIRPADANSGSLKLASASGAYKLRREANGDGYLLDITVEPSSDSAPRVMPVALEINDGSSGKLALQVTVNTQAENLIVTPGQLDLGELSLANLKSGSAGGSRVGIRKTLGSFRIKSLSSTLGFLKLEQRTIIEGSNYVIRVSFDQARTPKAAAYAGILRIETDDPQTPRLEIPVKVILKQ